MSLGNMLLEFCLLQVDTCFSSNHNSYLPFCRFRTTPPPQPRGLTWLFVKKSTNPLRWTFHKICFFCWDTKKMLNIQNWWTIPLRRLCPFFDKKCCVMRLDSFPLFNGFELDSHRRVGSNPAKASQRNSLHCQQGTSVHHREIILKGKCHVIQLLGNKLNNISII